jgi:hypothetical protein
MVTESLLTRAQEPTNGPYSEPDESSHTLQPYSL